MRGIIYVCGLYGAGKTTLIRAALTQMSEISSIQTYVTRAPRPGELEDKQGEYVFVTKEEYENLRLTKPHWDHTEIAGNFYGTDADVLNQEIAKGKSFIVAATIEIEKLKEMQRHYSGNKAVMWIDTPLDVCNERLRRRDKELAERKIQDVIQSKEAADQMRAYADTIFQPAEDPEKNAARFVEHIQTILTRWKDND